MAPTVPHILLTAHGSMPGGEFWTCGLRTYHRTTALSAASGAALAAAVANRWQNLANSNIGSYLFGGVAGRATVEGVTVREMDINGLTESQYEAPPSVAHTDGPGNVNKPNQCCLVVTLLTTRAGRTGKGRIYLPALAMPTANHADGVLVNFVDGLAPLIKTLLDGVNADLATHFGSALRLAVQSPTSAKKVFDDNSLADYNGAEIVGFKIGNVVDTQRRRRASVPETYTQLALA